ncbi:MAG: cytochrome bc complex cytochrome b subunit [Gallionella sp.]|nr:cytochrome bc complex cytochrome b subunit [Gallionella sp.]
MKPLKKLVDWIDYRFPIIDTIKEHATEYYAPKNFNFWYFFGGLALLALGIMILSGIFLAMSYKPDAQLAFGAVEYIMRDVQGGWLLRYIHSTGASMFFVVVYLHMFRGMMYGSYKEPRELLWVIGCVIYLALMAEAFMGYLLPWGQMSFWGAQVITNLFSTVPFIGSDLAILIRGDFVISEATLNRFFALHIAAIPLILVGIIFVHIVALHRVGSNNPDGIEIKKHKDANGHPLDGIPFHPYYTVKDSMGAVAFLFIFCAIIFFAPDMGGYFLEDNNFVPANPMKTPEHIAPVWYFTPYYAILRAVPPMFGSQFPGVVAMGIGNVIFFLLPWLDRGKVKSIRYRGPIYKVFLTLFVISFLGLGWLGTLPATPVYTWIARVLSIIYFAFFILMPWYTKIDKCKPEPDRVTFH